MRKTKDIWPLWMGIKWDGYWYCKIGPCVFKAELFSKFIEAMEYLGATEVLMAESRRAAMVRSDKGVCILMPVMIDERFNGLVLG